MTPEECLYRMKLVELFAIQFVKEGKAEIERLKKAIDAEKNEQKKIELHVMLAVKIQRDREGINTIMAEAERLSNIACEEKKNDIRK